MGELEQECLIGRPARRRRHHLVEERLACGALIIEGLERANHQVAGLPERLLVIRDQDLVNPDAPPSKSEPVVPKMLIDRDGDSANNGTGFGRPAKDLSVNFVPVPWPALIGVLVVGYLCWRISGWSPARALASAG